MEMAFLYFSINSTIKLFSKKNLTIINNRTKKNNENMKNRIFFLKWNKNQIVKIIERIMVVDGLMKKLHITENIIKKDELNV